MSCYTYVGTTGTGLRTAEAVRAAVCACAALVALLLTDVVWLALGLRWNASVRRRFGGLAVRLIRSIVVWSGCVARLRRRVVVNGRHSIGRWLWLVIWTVYVRQLTIRGYIGFIYWVWRISALTCNATRNIVQSYSELVI